MALFALAGACVPTAPRDRAYLSDELTARTGATIGVEARTEITAAPGTDPADGVDEDEAVALAMWNNAALHETLADLGFARADLAEAGALPNPTWSSFLPLGPKQLEFTFGLALDWIWGRPYRVSAASLDMERVAEELVARGLDTAREARVAHASLVRAERRLALAQEAASTWSEIARLARVRREAGAASLLEVNAVETDARAALIEADRAKQETVAARARLAEVLGMAGSKVDAVPATATASIAQPPERLVEMALAARPEVRAAEIAIEAAGERAGWETARIFSLIGLLDYNNRGTEAGPGVIVEIPLLNQNQAGRTRVEAELTAASWRYIGSRQRVEREVRESYAALTAASMMLDAWPKSVIEPLERNVELARHAYQAGGASYLAVLDATRRLIDAKQREVDLSFERRRALAELARSVGRMPR